MRQQRQAVNRECMTWEEWQCAAHALQATNVMKGFLFTEWERGVDPTEYAASFQGVGSRDDEWIREGKVT